MKAVWSHRERSRATGHANGGKVKTFSRAEIDEMNRNRCLEAQDFLDARSPFQVKVDSIRSRGHVEHQVELRDRPADFALGHARFEYDVNEVLRRGPWYMSADELLQADEIRGETYEFLPQVLEHRARQREQV